MGYLRVPLHNTKCVSSLCKSEAEELTDGVQLLTQAITRLQVRFLLRIGSWMQQEKKEPRTSLGSFCGVKLHCAVRSRHQMPHSAFFSVMCMDTLVSTRRTGMSSAAAKAFEPDGRRTTQILPNALFIARLSEARRDMHLLERICN